MDKSVDGQVLAKHLAEELHRLGAHTVLQPRVIDGIDLLVRREHADSVQLQPLPREVVDETAGFAVREHAIDFLRQTFALEHARFRHGEERVVRHRTPEEIREPRGEFRIGETLSSHRVALDEVNEVPRGQHALQRHAIGIRHLLAYLALGAVGSQILFQLPFFHWTTPGALGEALQMLLHHLECGVIGRYNIFAPQFFRIRYQWAFPLDPIEDHRGEQAVTFAIEHLRRGRSQQMSLAAVRENVGGSVGKAVAEGGSGSPIDAVGGHDGPVQRRRHVEIHLELIDLRAVLGGGDIELDESSHGFLAGGFADAQVGRLAAEWADAAGLDAQAIEPAVFRAGFSEPLGRQRGFDLTREDEVAHGALDAEFLQSLRHALAAAAAHFQCGLTNLAGLAGRG